MGAQEELVTEVRGLEAFIAVDSFASGIAGGGLRFHPDVTIDELRLLARTMSLKWATLGLSIGGCKLGIRGDPARVDKAEVIRDFATQSAPFVGSRVFTGPDLGTSPADLKHFFEANGKDSYDVAAAHMSYVGLKPTPKEDYRRILRALQGHITGRAVARATRKAWGKVGGALGGARVSVQGYGSVGKVLIEELDHMGAQVVCVADAEGCVYHPEGLDPRLLSGSVPGLMARDKLPPKAQKLPRERWVGVEAEILVPAAVANAINWTNVGDVQARLVAEAANIPVPEDVEHELHRRGVIVLPDFLVNGGLAGAFGVLVTARWKNPGDVEVEVIQRIVSSTARVVQTALTSDLPPRSVAVEALTGRGA